MFMQLGMKCITNCFTVKPVFHNYRIKQKLLFKLVQKIQVTLHVFCKCGVNLPDLGQILWF